MRTADITPIAAMPTFMDSIAAVMERDAAFQAPDVVTNKPGFTTA